MKEKKGITLFCIFALLFAFLGGVSELSAQGSAEIPFLSIPLGARSIGMGRAFTGVSNDIQSIIWNPAGLALLQRMEVSYSRLESFEYEIEGGTSGINYNLISVGIPVEKYGSFGFSLEIQNYGQTPLMSQEGTFLGFSTDRGYVFYGTYATPVFDKLDIGFDFKYLMVSFAALPPGTKRKGSTSAIDIGGLYRPLKNMPLQIGVAFRNLGFPLQFEDEYQKDPLPRRLVVGVGYDLLQHLLKSDQLSLLVSMDLKFRRTKSIHTEGSVIETEEFLGVEVGYDRMLFFRVGYVNELDTFDTHGPTFGIGFNYKGIMFDLARELVSDLGDETHISAGYRF
jgi:hypothetical protein